MDENTNVLGIKRKDPPPLLGTEEFASLNKVRYNKKKDAEDLILFCVVSLISDNSKFWIGRIATLLFDSLIFVHILFS
jgi:hypothetical protein